MRYVFRFLNRLFASQTEETVVRAFLLSPFFRNYLWVFSLGVVLGGGIIHGMAGAGLYAQNVLITRADYERIEIDMSLTIVEAILGQGIEVSQSESTVTFEWEMQSGDTLTAIFKNDQLISKAQSGQ